MATGIALGFVEVEEEEKVEDDTIGFLIDITDMSEAEKAEVVTTMPTPDTTSDPENPEEVAAISVKMYPGLWYQAEWGSDLHNLTPGEKFQADGLKTCIGVIKQTGPRGFYRIRVSETE